MSCRRLLMAGLGCVVLAGCNTVYKNIGTQDPYLGESVKYDAAVQIINPDPVYPEGASEPGSSGAKGAAAVKRYRSDQVKQVETLSSMSTGSGGPR